MFCSLLIFIGESLGMQELILIGVIALIVFGPRKLPQIARTIGKTMTEFRKATNDFKATWQKEVDLESLETDLETSSRDPEPVSSANSIAKTNSPPAESTVESPEVRYLQESHFGKASITSTSPSAELPDTSDNAADTLSEIADSSPDHTENEETATALSKRNWL